MLYTDSILDGMNDAAVETASEMTTAVFQPRRATAAPIPLRFSASEPDPTRFAPLGDFSVLRSHVLSGERLAQVRSLQDSIARFGLLAPLVAVRRKGRLIVVDGRKRLAALRRLAFQDRLPRSLVNVPYLVAGEQQAPARRNRAVVSNPELYAAVVDRFRSGDGLDGIASTFHISRKCVRDVLSLSRLDPAVRQGFFERLIDFVQASAFATIPDRKVQRRVLQQLGPFASAGDIEEAARTAINGNGPQSVMSAA